MTKRKRGTEKIACLFGPNTSERRRSTTWPHFSFVCMTFGEKKVGQTSNPTIRHLAEVHGLSLLSWMFRETPEGEAKEDTSRHDGGIQEIKKKVFMALA